MSRYCPHNIAPVLAAAERWKERCLVGGKSVLSDRELWTTEAYEELHRLFVLKPDVGDRNFLDKLKDQLTPASPTTKQLAAEMLWVLSLFPSRNAMGPEKKRSNITEVWAWSGEPLATEISELGAPLEEGIGRPGTAYSTKRDLELSYLIEVCRQLATKSADERRNVLEGDQWKLGEFLDAVEGGQRRQLSHILRFLLQPDSYERISTGRDKRRILSSFRNLPVAELRKWSPTRMDRAIFDLRNELQAKEGTTDLDYYISPLRERWQPSDKYWKIAPGENARFWDRCREDGFIAVGWDDLGDLSDISHDEFNRRVATIQEEHPDWKKARLNQVWEFSQIEEGARIVANRGTKEVLGIGTVTGGYYFVENKEYGHRLTVTWDDLRQRSVNEGGWRRTLVKLAKSKFEEIAGSAFELPSEPSGKKAFAVGEAAAAANLYSAETLSDESGFHLDSINKWLQQAQRKKHFVFQGPPGTGKTYLAERLGRLLRSGTRGIQELVQFHPSYTYEDFMQGIRPEVVSNQLSFKLAPGRFLDFCRRAAALPDSEPCVLVIDELNRANLSRVFGELMYLLEHRNERVPLAGGGSTFCVPPNVYIIGTMNTADRSIALVDHALRRRFTFAYLGPDYDVLHRQLTRHGLPGESLGNALRKVNAAIGSPHYEIGISFFVAPGQKLAEQLPAIWEGEIEPYLEEYFFDQPEKVKELRWPAISSLLADWPTLGG